MNKDGEAFGEADAVTAEGMAVDECVGQMIRGISNKVDDFLVCSSLERFAYRLFSYLPLRTATKPSSQSTKSTWTRPWRRSHLNPTPFFI